MYIQQSEKIMIERDIKRKFCVSSTEQRIHLFRLVCDVTGEDRDAVINEMSLRYIIDTLESDKTKFIYDDKSIHYIKKVFTE